MKTIVDVRLLLSSVLLGLSFQANAVIFNTFTDIASFQSATSSLITEDFSGEPVGVITSRDFGDFETSWTNGSAGNYPMMLNEEIILQKFGHLTVFNLNFDLDLIALGFDWRNTDTSGDDIELLVDGQSFTFGYNGLSGFFGVVATNGTFNTVGFSDTFGDGGGLNFGYIDNLRYTGQATVPVPPSLALLGLGLAGIGYRRKKAA